ncbi:MAG: hypothetical protein J7623_12810 [Chitinophaga sp.]|uniref:hypothetical protein n=1 Tax=Chitinophaga sp. TaxID=1869181 RepID=UPI001B1CC157|nr:hypothetical protein [Chitinophaga sp.]MBO9729510.1 hypothetical protein [Chitinophaga sp.]
MALNQMFIATVIIYLGCIISLYSGSAFSMLIFSMLPGIAYLLTATFMPAFTGKRTSPSRTGVVDWIALAVFSVLFAYLLDRLVYVISPDVPKAYGKMFERYLVESGKVPQGIKLRRVEVFAGLPFFLQNVYTNILGIALGVFAGHRLARWKGRSAASSIRVNTLIEQQ